MDTKKILGNHIKQLRVDRKISQRQFALMVGTNRTFLGKIESGRQNVSITTLEKIAMGLDMTVIELFKTI
jgi:transcriptional regulator with XRE-family HTH domain